MSNFERVGVLHKPVIFLFLLLLIPSLSEAKDLSFSQWLKKNLPSYSTENVRYGKNPSAHDSDLSGGEKTFCSAKDIFNGKPSHSPDYEIFSNPNNHIYFYKFKTRIAQDLTLDRISDFVEQQSRKSIDLKKHDYDGETDGNDVRGEDIALFFTKIKSLNGELTSYEKELRDNLVRSGHLSVTATGDYKASANFVIISAAVDSGIETAHHEISHAVYMTDPLYRRKIIDLYKSLSDSEQQVVKKTLLEVGNHTPEKDLDVFYTEFGAYLRDPPALLDMLDDPIKQEDKKIFSKISGKILAIEAQTDFYKSCSETTTAPSVNK